MTLGTVATGVAILLLFCMAGTSSFGLVGAVVGPLIGIALFFGALWAMRATGAIEETRFCRCIRVSACSTPIIRFYPYIYDLMKRRARPDLSQTAAFTTVRFRPHSGGPIFASGTALHAPEGVTRLGAKVG